MSRQADRHYLFGPNHVDYGKLTELRLVAFDQHDRNFAFQGSLREPRVCSLIGRRYNKCERVRYKGAMLLKDAFAS
jgi:hypothetical protein